MKIERFGTLFVPPSVQEDCRSKLNIREIGAI